MSPASHGVTRLLTCAGLTAALLLPAAVPAVAAPVRGVPAAEGEKGQELPAMPTALDPEADETACTPASRAKAEKQDWSRQRLDLDRLHRQSDGAGVTVALIDTGVASGAAGLDGRVSAKGAAGDDCVGHGTFLAGLIAGTGGENPRLAGVAPGAKILALRGTDTRGRAGAGLVVDAVREATAAGADVIAVAVALPHRDGALTRAVASARRAGAVVVAAATPDPPRGGTGETPSRTYWPAGEPGVLSVADMLPGGARPDDAPRTGGVDLVAPGAEVVSGGPRGDGQYLGNGAAVAAAYAAGAVAVVRAAHPEEAPDAVTRRLTATAYPAGIPQLDPYAAVTTVLGDPARSVGAERAVRPVTVRDTTAADRATGRATLFVLLGAATVLAVLWAGFAVSRARARGWRPAGAGGTDQE
ncbi:S8 family serine peptidase [Streptomyces tsukubensis]|uniref:Serine protease n=1 Tax=Streptomyces tsukubensis TaxID=83656 RepID=A0A1V4A7L4_9ACTN|nr:S8 family serine peptidase [Streptomyces tsukubensis]OON78071.1 serine protease [Streptomyces tsukubensis]QFR97237.1 S8 family serine peptidase [Streptomyces tsukubensis]